MKLNVNLDYSIANVIEQLLKEYEDIFAWTYKDLKNIPPHQVHNWIELDTNIPTSHQTRYWMNPNYVKAVKQYLDKLLAMKFIILVEEATWLSPIVVVSKKNGKLWICMDF